MFGWGGGLPCKGVGAKKFGMSQDIPIVFAGISRGRPKSLRKNIAINFRPSFLWKVNRRRQAKTKVTMERLQSQVHKLQAEVDAW